jgi:hypothetical protein
MVDLANKKRAISSKQNRSLYPDREVYQLCLKRLFKPIPVSSVQGMTRPKQDAITSPYNYFWGTATLVQVEPEDPACDRFKGIELPFQIS